LVFAAPNRSAIFLQFEFARVNKKKHRPFALEWFWAEILRSFPKAEAKFRKQYVGASIPSVEQWNHWFPQLLQLAYDPEIVQPADSWLKTPIDSLESEIQQYQIQLHTDFADCYRFFPDYTLFVMQFVRERIRQIKKHPLREFLLRHPGGNFLAKGRADGSLAKLFKDIEIPGVKFTTVGLEIKDNVKFEDWKAGLEALMRLDDATKETPITSEVNQVRSISDAEEKEIIDAIERESGKPITNRGPKVRKEMFHAVREELRRLNRLPKPVLMQKNRRNF
jgi:hypothetical protein